MKIKMKEILRPYYRAILRSLGQTPMLRVMSSLKKRNYDSGKMDFVEVFGGTGDLHLRDYVNAARSINVWEISAETAEQLKKNVPQCSVKIVDSFEEVLHHDHRYDGVVIDNPMSTYGKWCEHFGLFPAVFNLAAQNAVMVLNVIPRVNKKYRTKYPYLFNDKQLESRSLFYSTDRPEEVPFEKMIETYSSHAKSKGYVIDWWFAEPRTYCLYYLVLGIHAAEKTLESVTEAKEKIV